MVTPSKELVTARTAINAKAEQLKETKKAVEVAEKRIKTISDAYETVVRTNSDNEAELARMKSNHATETDNLRSNNHKLQQQNDVASKLIMTLRYPKE